MRNLPLIVPPPPVMIDPPQDKWWHVAIVFSLLIGLILGIYACTPGQREAARTVLDITKTLCIVANQALPDSEVAKICGITGPLLDPMKEVLTGARSASAQAVAGAHVGVCGNADAGAK